ncbi:hypothetical protein NDN08_003233 [Rhodosorus marinus]|uniref:Class I SAM-dependent methyltransferase n=1 Tax=Rhodosorus marinus TaxID=101924 RepID=A0AAV8UXG9_9RHOD|nr:hypothetical protein NDN08_003233 [Rhodosorus marinus]
MSFELDYTAYLRAKVAIDDEALNKRVYGSFVSHLEALSVSKSGPLRILEVAGGIGTMIVRICRDSPSLLGKKVCYDLVDVKKSNLWSAAEYLRENIVKEGETFSVFDGLDSLGSAKEQFGYSIGSHYASSRGDGHISCVLGDLQVNLICSDGLEYASKNRIYDVVISAAFLDLVDIDSAVMDLSSAMCESSLLYLPINFDGVTHFEPDVPTCAEEGFASLVEERFHLAMGSPSGYSRSRTGRKLMRSFARAEEVSLESFGSSSWAVFPYKGAYKEDEKYFLHSILTFMEETLRQDDTLDNRLLSDYIEGRRTQIKNAQLFYLAHNVDYLAVKSLPSKA